MSHFSTDAVFCIVMLHMFKWEHAILYLNITLCGVVFFQPTGLKYKR